MTDKPRIGELARGAKQFVRDNRSYLRTYATPLVIPLVILAGVERIGSVYADVLGSLVPLVASYFTACLLLAWHRASLLGPKAEHKVDPFRLKPGEGRFIGLFYLLTLLMAAFMLVGMLPSILLAHGHASMKLLAVGAGLLAFIAVIVSIRFTFMLPARSVNAPVGWKESWHISQGLLWRLLAAGFLVAIGPMLILGCAATAGGGIVAIGHFYTVDDASNIHLTLPGAVIMFIFEGIPAVLINFVIVARSVTILSRLYQWSVQNRHQEQAA